MQIKTMNAGLLRKCFLAAAANVEKNKEYINELNVFPVPDGDTGTNVSMTLMSAVEEVVKAPGQMQDICRAISQGTLRGARGNSGVIFSQLMRGFTKVAAEHDELDARILADAFRRAQETAYKAVMKPKEGTILTVARGMSEKMDELAPTVTDLTELCEKVADYGEKVLNQTPELLPVLKEAGVVDSGGMALMMAMRGAVAVLAGKETEIMNAVPMPSAGKTTENAPAGHVTISTDEIKFGYCTECIINLKSREEEKNVPALKEFLLSIGDSVVCVEDDGIVKIHVHTNHPGLVFEKGLEMGMLSRLKVDNLHEEHQEKLIKEAERLSASASEVAAAAERRKPSKKRAIVAVCAGKELANTFRDLGADLVIEGGQTMNPSIQDILSACEKADAQEVFVLPNNKNIILASQAAEGSTEGRFRILTVPSKTIMQGVQAMFAYGDYDPEDGSVSPEALMEAMQQRMDTVKSGEVTYAVRNTSVDGFSIKEGDIMGIGDSGMLAVGSDLNQVTLDMIEKMVGDGSSIITVFYGTDTKEEAAEELRNHLVQKYPDMETDVEKGGQPVYYYFVSVE